MELGWADIAVLMTYFGAILGVGLWFGRGERDTGDFFLGGRRQHWLVVGLSIIATEVSALTYIAVPADSFNGDWNYLQMYAGAFLGRMLIVLLLLPAFYGGNVTTVYEYLGQRFGPWTRTTAASMFFVSRILGSGIRLLAASLAIAVVFGWRLEWVVLGATAVAVAYTTFGGIKAIIWTDAVQAFVFIGGAIVAVMFLSSATAGGGTEPLSLAYDARKFHVFTWDADPNNVKSFWVLLIHATVLNMAALGTDQELTQRMLTCPDLRRGQRSVIFNALLGFPVVCLFLLVGTLIWNYYQQPSATPPPAEVIDQHDRIFPYVIAQVIPSGWGIKGLLVAGIFASAMSSLDSALGALSSTAVTDFYRPLKEHILRRKTAPPQQPPREAGERRLLLLSRAFTLLFGGVLAAVALAFAHHEGLLWEAFRWASLIFGGMLGIFLLGVTTKKRGRDPLNMLAMLSAVALLVVLKLYQESTGQVYAAWPWWVVIGSGWTYGLAALSRTVPR